MTVLSAQTIRRLGIFTPFHERTTEHGMTYGLGPAGYDVRIAEDITLANAIYGKYSFRLASTIEHFTMPIDVIGYVKDKSTWARRGVLVQNTVIEPGWRGFLTLEISYEGPHTIRIPAGSPIAQIVFHRLDEPTEIPYEGKYQDQPAGPVQAILDHHR